MTTRRSVQAVLLTLTAGLALSATAQQPATNPKTLPAPRPAPAPKLEAVAETKLLMEGLIQPNFSGLEKHLGQRPGDGDAWSVTRGQALLVSEAGNLLMLRPPKSGGSELWMQRATELREAGASLARNAAARDFERSVAGLRDVANVCNHCHQNFRVPTRVGAGPP